MAHVHNAIESSVNTMVFIRCQNSRGNACSKWNDLRAAYILPFVVCRSNKRRRWRAAGVDDPGGSSSKWTPVKPSCSSTRNALLAGKRVLLVSLLRAKHELYDQGFQDLQLPSPRCLRAAKARLVCSLVCSADLVVSVWSLFKPPPPWKHKGLFGAPNLDNPSRW